MRELTIVKIGGNIVDDESVLHTFVSEFSRLDNPKILVHGGGKSATRMAKQLGVSTSMVDGRRVTNKAMLPVVVMVYAGLINKQLVANLQASGCDALGLCGADMGIIASHKRANSPVDYGFVGDFEATAVNATRISQLLSLGITPVFSAITADTHGQLLNTNADTIASHLAEAMASAYEVTLVYCFERRGVLLDVNDTDSVISQLDRARIAELKANGTIAEGMLPKLENALHAVDCGVRRVCIKSAMDLNTPHAGTEITL